MTTVSHGTAPRVGDAGLSTGTGRAVARTAGGGLVAGVAGATVLYAYGSAVAATSIPLRAGDPWASSAMAVSPANFSLGVLVCTFWGTVIAMVLTVASARPARTFAVTSGVLAVASLAVPIAAVDTEMSTKLVLALGHLLAAAVVVPVLVRALPRTRR